MGIFDKFKPKQKEIIVPEFNPTKMDIHDGTYSLKNVELFPASTLNGQLSSSDFVRWVTNEVGEDMTYEDALVSYHNHLVLSLEQLVSFGCDPQDRDEIVNAIQEIRTELVAVGVIKQ